MLTYAQDFKFGKVSKDALKEASYALDFSASAAYLYKHRRTYYTYDQNSGFTQNTEVALRIKIYDKNGLNYGNQLLNYYKPETGESDKISNIKGYTFNLENGKVTKDKLNKNHIFDEDKGRNYNVKKIAFPNVKEGSIIDLSYTKRSKYTRFIEDVNLQYGIPVRQYETKIEIPEYFIFRKNSRGYYHIAPNEFKSNKKVTTTNRSERNFYTGRSSVSNSSFDFTVNNDVYKASNIPALRDNEPYVSNVRHYRGSMIYELSAIKFPNARPEYYSTTWEDVSKKIHEFSGFGNELNKRNYFKKDLTEHIGATTNEKDKLALIFAFVKSKVKWNSYSSKYTDLGVKKAYNTGVGNVADLNLMLTAMLREAGLNANPVLVSTKDHGTPLFPTLKGFNYVISMVEFSNNTFVLLDATEPLSTPNVLPSRVLNWNGRKIKKDGTSSWVNLTPAQHAEKDTKLYVKITPDKTIEGFVRTTYHNLFALGYRSKNKSLKEEVIKTNIEESNAFEIEEFRTSNITEIHKPVSTSIKFVSDNHIEEINSKLYINPLCHLTMTENPFKTNKRTFPVDYTAPWLEKNLVVMTMPEGYAVEFIPESFGVGLPDNLGVFKYVVKQTGNKLSIQSVFKMNSSLISPQYFQELKEFYAQLVAKQSEKIILAPQ